MYSKVWQKDDVIMFTQFGPDWYKIGKSSTFQNQFSVYMYFGIEKYNIMLKTDLWSLSVPYLSQWWKSGPKEPISDTPGLIRDYRLNHSDQIWAKSGSDWPQMAHHGLFQIRFQYILARRAKIHLNLTRKSPGFIPFGAQSDATGGESIHYSWAEFGLGHPDSNVIRRRQLGQRSKSSILTVVVSSCFNKQSEFDESRVKHCHTSV